MGILNTSFNNNVVSINGNLQQMESAVESITLNPGFSKFFYERTAKNPITVNELLDNMKKLLASFRFHETVKRRLSVRALSELVVEIEAMLLRIKNKMTVGITPSEYYSKNKGK